MDTMWFFLLIFTAIYGAVRLVAIAYDGIIGLIRKKGCRNGDTGNKSEFTRNSRHR